MAELEKEKAGLADEKSYLTAKLAKEKDEIQKLMHNLNLVSSELTSTQQQVRRTINSFLPTQ